MLCLLFIEWSIEDGMGSLVFCWRSSTWLIVSGFGITTKLALFFLFIMQRLRVRALKARLSSFYRLEKLLFVALISTISDGPGAQVPACGLRESQLGRVSMPLELHRRDAMHQQHITSTVESNASFASLSNALPHLHPRSQSLQQYSIHDSSPL